MRSLVVCVFLSLLSLLSLAGLAQQEVPAAPSAVKLPSQPPSSPPAPPPSVEKSENRESAGDGQPQLTDPVGFEDDRRSAVAPASAPQAQGPQPQSTGPAKPPAKPRGDDEEPLTTIRKRVDEVNVIFTVTDKRGRFIKDLTRENVEVRDDDKPPRTVVSFRSETDLPLRVGLLIDASNSIRSRFRFEQQAAIEFLHQILRQNVDQAFVLGFDSIQEVTQDFTDSTEKLSQGVRMLRPGGGTALYDAIFWTSREKFLELQSGRPVRKAIILLSDGQDNQSRVTREEAIEMAQRAEVIIYTISTNISGQKLSGDKVLERFAEQTGGRAFFPFKASEVADAFADIEDELRSQYAISYRPADFEPNGEYRTIEIEARTQKGKELNVRARKGYYAPLE